MQHCLTQNDKTFHEHRGRVVLLQILLRIDLCTLSNGRSFDGAVFFFCVLWSNGERSGVVHVSGILSDTNNSCLELYT